MTIAGDIESLHNQLKSESGASMCVDIADALISFSDQADESTRAKLVLTLPTLLQHAVAEVRCMGVALAAMVLEGEPQVAVLTRSLSDRHERVQLEAAGRIADMARPDLRAVLAPLISHSDFRIQFEAARGMALLCHSAGIDVLIAGLDRPDFRFRAAGALATLKDRAAIAPLERCFRQWLIPHFDRTQIAGALASFGVPSGANHLKARAQKRRAIDRAMAIELLGETRVEGADELLGRMAHDAGDACRGAAIRALGRLGDMSHEPLLVSLLTDASLSDDLRLDAAFALVHLNTPSHRDQIASVSLRSVEAQGELAALLS